MHGRVEYKRYRWNATNCDTICSLTRDSKLLMEHPHTWAHQHMWPDLRLSHIHKSQQILMWYKSGVQVQVSHDDRWMPCPQKGGSHAMSCNREMPLSVRMHTKLLPKCSMAAFSSLCPIGPSPEDKLTESSLSNSSKMKVWKVAAMVSIDSCRIRTLPLTPNGVDYFLACWSFYLARGNRKSAPFGLGDYARRTSSSPMGGAHSNGESYPQAKGARHKGNFSERLFTIVGTSQLPGLNNKKQIYIYLPSYKSHTSRVWWAYARDN